MGQFAKDLEAGVDFFPGEGLQAFGAKTLYGKRSHYTSIEESTLPVSYTHLDVYKRQFLICSVNGRDYRTARCVQ